MLSITCNKSVKTETIFENLKKNPKQTNNTNTIWQRKELQQVKIILDRDEKAYKQLFHRHISVKTTLYTLIADCVECAERV